MTDSPEAIDSVIASWSRIADQVDAFFEAVRARSGPEFHCGPGCTDCCHQDLLLLPLEAAVVARALSDLPQEHLAASRLRAERPEGPCALLHRERCLIYPWRPLICRSHGLPILYRDDPEEPPQLSLCSLNFVGATPPQDALLDGNLLLLRLGVADRLALPILCPDEPEPRRVSISHLVLAGLCSIGSPRARR